MWICSEQTSTTFNSVTWDVFFLLKTGIIKRGWEIPKEMTVFQWGDS